MLRWILWLATASRLPVSTFAQDHHQESQQQRLGVVVPAYDGDLARAVSSLERWPAKCSPLTLKNADLVLYYAEEASSATESALDNISSTAGRCFSRTRIVYAHLSEEVCEQNELLLNFSAVMPPAVACGRAVGLRQATRRAATFFYSLPLAILTGVVGHACLHKREIHHIITSQPVSLDF